MTGKKRLQPLHFLEDLTSPIYGDERSKNILRLRMSHQFSSSSNSEYFGSMNMLLAVLYRVFKWRHECPHISYISKALETIYKLAANSDNVSFINTCPKEVISSIAELLSPGDLFDLPYYGSGVTATVMELDMRNGALDALLAMCSQSSTVLLVVGALPRCLELLYTISTAYSSNSSGGFLQQQLGDSSTGNGNNPYSGSSNPTLTQSINTNATNINSGIQALNHLLGISCSSNFTAGSHAANLALSKLSEGSQKAAQLMSLLLSHPEFAHKFRLLRADLYLAACADDNIAGLVA